MKTKIDKQKGFCGLMMRWSDCLRLHLGLINNISIFHAVCSTQVVDTGAVEHASYPAASTIVKQSEIELRKHYQVNKKH